MGDPADDAGPAGDTGDAAAGAQPFVRPARLADAAAFAAVQHRSWAHAAAEHGLPPPPPLDDMERAWERAITVPPSPHHRSWIAVDRAAAGEEVRGVAALAPASDPDLEAQPKAEPHVGPHAESQVPASVELVVLAVDPAARGRGHGSRLVAAAMDGAVADGTREAVMWVASGDDLTRQFLEAAGWAADGAFRTLAAEGGAPSAPAAELRQVRLATSLEAHPPHEASGSGEQ